MTDVPLEAVELVAEVFLGATTHTHAEHALTAGCPACIAAARRERRNAEFAEADEYASLAHCRDPQDGHLYAVPVTLRWPVGWTEADVEEWQQEAIGPAMVAALARYGLPEESAVATMCRLDVRGITRGNKIARRILAADHPALFDTTPAA